MGIIHTGDTVVRYTGRRGLRRRGASLLWYQDPFGTKDVKKIFISLVSFVPPEVDFSTYIRDRAHALDLAWIGMHTLTAFLHG